MPADKRQVLSFTLLAYHELESIVIVTIILIATLLLSSQYAGWLAVGFLLLHYCCHLNMQASLQWDTG